MKIFFILLVINSILGYLIGLLGLYIWNQTGNWVGRECGCEYKTMPKMKWHVRIIVFLLWPLSSMKYNNGIAMINDWRVQTYLIVMTIFGPLPKVSWNVFSIIVILVGLIVTLVFWLTGKIVPMVQKIFNPKWICPAK